MAGNPGLGIGDSGLGKAVIARRRLHESRIPNPEFRLSIDPLLRRHDDDVVVAGVPVHRAVVDAGFALVADPAPGVLLPLSVLGPGDVLRSDRRPVRRDWL